MKVFISWSGERSKSLAFALKDWLPLVLQYVQPWVSEKDISAGERWAQAIAGELEASNFGILCITPENLSSEWIMFEAGALSKSMQDAKVIPLLFGLELSDLSGPLSQFQALKIDQQGLLDVAKAINAVSENKTADSTISKLIPALWPQLQLMLDAIPENKASGRHLRPQTEVLEELVSQVRGLNSRVRDYDAELSDRELNLREHRFREFDPRMMFEAINSVSHPTSSDTWLLLLAGMVRERAPWLSEVMIEAHREFKTASVEEATAIASSLLRTVEEFTQGPFSKLISGRSKSSYILMKELSSFLGFALDMKLGHSKMNRKYMKTSDRGAGYDNDAGA